jgi:hypothetical protein
LTQAACSDGTTDCMMVELRWCHTAGSHHKTLDTAAVAACLQMPVSKASVAVKPVDSSTYEVSTTLDRSGVYLAAISVRTEGGTHALSNSGFTLSVSAPEASYTVSSTCSGDECYCKPGYEISDTEASDGKIVCSLCPQGTFKAGFSNDATCTACPASTSTVVDIAASVDACQCPSGLYNTHHTTVQCIDQDWTSPVALEAVLESSVPRVQLVLSATLTAQLQSARVTGPSRRKMMASSLRTSAHRNLDTCAPEAWCPQILCSALRDLRVSHAPCARQASRARTRAVRAATVCTERQHQWTHRMSCWWSRWSPSRSSWASS